MIGPIYASCILMAFSTIGFNAKVRAVKTRQAPTEAEVIDCIHMLQDGQYNLAVQFRGTRFADHSLRIVLLIFGNDGSAIPGISKHVNDALKICAACMEIFENSTLPACIQIEGNWTARLTPKAAANQVLSAARHALRMENFRDHGVKHVKVISGSQQDVCPTCASVINKRFRVEKAPQVPHATCTCSPDFGCRCMVVADV